MLDAVAGKVIEQRQAEPERHRQPPGRRTGPVERGDAEAGDRAAEMLAARAMRRMRDAEQREQAAQPGDRGDAGGGEPAGRLRRQWRSPPRRASASTGTNEVRQRSGSPLPTSPRSKRAGRVSPALATIRQLAAKLISTPNSAASPSAIHCGPVSGATGSSGPASLPTSAGAAAPTARPARMASPAISPISASSIVSIVARGGTDQLQDGDGRAARGGEGGGGARHAEPADRQRRQGDQQQHLAQPVDEPARAGAGFVAVGGAPAAVGKLPLERLARRFGIGTAGRSDSR